MSCLVLIACYQGERFLPAQLDSLLNQTFKDFRILARDDGSTDRTKAILEEYSLRYPEKITVLPSGARLGVVGNFNALLEQANSDIIFFCDQDDIWEDNKVELTLKAFRTKTPLLVHTDLQLVDENAISMHRSFWEYSQIDPLEGNNFNRVLVQNHVTGCTMAINKPLRDLAYPIPKDAIMHDWWISLIASSCGEILALSEKTIRYRQHSSNTLGARTINWIDGLKKLFLFLKTPEINTEAALLRQSQATALHERFKKIMSPCKLKTLELFLKAPDMTILKRKWVYLLHKFSRQGLKKTIPYLFQNRPF
jgi:glycosyltransferase involved in cell wall biosynthesis